MLEIKNLHASVGGNEILRGRGPDGEAGRGARDHGAQRLGQEHARARAGRAGPATRSPAAQVLYKGRDLLALSPEERAREGVFLAFQYPVEIPGVSNVYFLKAALNSIRKHRGEPELDAMDFLALVKEKAKLVDIDESLVKRPVNEGFSGGEKKRNEIFQMAVLDPALAILDETDSGLDIDALRVVASGVNQLRSPERAMVLVTHYQRLLNYIVPDFVHVLVDGRIVRSGGKELALELEDTGLRVAAAGAPAPGAMSALAGGSVSAAAEGTEPYRAEFERRCRRAGGRAGLAAARRAAAALERFLASGSRPRTKRTGASRASPAIARTPFAGPAPAAATASPRRPSSRSPARTRPPAPGVRGRPLRAGAVLGARRPRARGPQPARRARTGAAAAAGAARRATARAGRSPR